MYVYCSNESNQDVYFDNLQVVQTRSQLIEERHYYPGGMAMQGISSRAYGKLANAYGYHGKELQASEYYDGSGLEEYDFEARYYDPQLMRWHNVDPIPNGASPYSSMNNNPVLVTDPDGKCPACLAIAIGAVVGAYAGASIESGNWNPSNWNSNWWKGAIVGAFVGAGIGAGVASAAGLSGITTSTGAVSQGWGVTTSIINGANVSMAFSAASGGGIDNLWKAGLVGAVGGAFTSTGGFGLAKNGLFGSKIAGKLAYQAIGTSSQSIGNNWASGQPLFSRVKVGLGPVNLTFGKGQPLFDWSNNIGNIAMNGYGLINLAFGGKVSWDWKNLSANYSGGIADKLFPVGPDNNWAAGFSPFAVTGNSNLGVVYSHELHHLWQSRSMGDIFAPNYLLQGLLSFALNGSYDSDDKPSFVSPLGNYYESIPDYYRWW